MISGGWGGWGGSFFPNTLETSERIQRRRLSTGSNELPDDVLSPLESHPAKSSLRLLPLDPPSWPRQLTLPAPAAFVRPPLGTVGTSSVQILRSQHISQEQTSLLQRCNVRPYTVIDVGEVTDFLGQEYIQALWVGRQTIAWNPPIYLSPGWNR